MPRILGVDIPAGKRMEAALPYLYGVGPVNVLAILKEAEIDLNLRAKDLTDDQIARVGQIIQSKYVVEGDLRREVSENIKRMTTIGTYRGLRHRKGLPVRGQNTKNNSRTRKGRKPSVGGKRK